MYNLGVCEKSVLLSVPLCFCPVTPYFTDVAQEAQFHLKKFPTATSVTECHDKEFKKITTQSNKCKQPETHHGLTGECMSMLQATIGEYVGFFF